MGLGSRGASRPLPLPDPGVSLALALEVKRDRDGTREPHCHSDLSWPKGPSSWPGPRQAQHFRAFSVGRRRTTLLGW